MGTSVQREYGPGAWDFVAEQEVLDPIAVAGSQVPA